MVHTMRQICHVNLARGYRGGERQTELLVRAIAARGLNQRVIVRQGEPLARRLHDVPGVDIRAIGKPFFRHAFKGRGFLLHAHDGHGAKFACAASVLAGSPYVVTRRISKQPGNNLWTRAVFRRANAVVAVAQSVANDLKAYMPTLEPSVIHSAIGELPVNPQRRDLIRRRLAGAFLIVNVAALIQSQKGQLHLIAAARRLATERPDVAFILLGDGRDRIWFESEARGLSNMTFEGFVDNVGDYLAAADAFVLPSLHEGIGGACLDAMYFGLPIIATAVDGVPEIVQDGHNGLLIPPADETALVDAICRIHDDQALAEALGASGRAMAQKHLPERMAERYLEV